MFRLKGFLGYYRKFIRGYGSVVAPLTTLLNKNAFHWSKEVNLAFHVFKTVITHTIVLRLPNFSKEFTIECDTFGVELGAVVVQGGQPITFNSKRFKGKTLLISTYEKELLI